ncbi:hypothetical protein Tcur_1027 [Thermomonospora curvata DSM 43183]|uniref:Uncharacterized protein n=2 Tax=Thermomonosporaceae TaxID=2012 RepID=D1A7M4_THECD|nr:hypothetical protein Tcur_1027 [Thermomonospora curvata DSM 43183]PKK15416.1 MAG: hypothetical protein BUE48_004985 [Thermomonospora sp. CIF 1]
MGMDPAEETAEDLRAQLREVENDLAVLRAEAAPPSEEPQDFGDAAEEITQREELAALIETLERRRERLRAALGET